MALATLHPWSWFCREPAMPAVLQQEGQVPGIWTHIWLFMVCWKKNKVRTFPVGMLLSYPIYFPGEVEPISARVTSPTSAFPLPPITSSKQSRAQQHRQQLLKTPIPASNFMNIFING